MYKWILIVIIVYGSFLTIKCISYPQIPDHHRSIDDIFVTKSLGWCFLLLGVIWSFTVALAFVVFTDLTACCKSLNKELEISIRHISGDDPVLGLEIMDKTRLRFHQISDMVSSFSKAYGKNLFGNCFVCGTLVMTGGFIISVTVTEAIEKTEFVYFIVLSVILLIIWILVGILSLLAEGPQNQVTLSIQLYF
jgi:hypothetical protein